MSRLLIDQYLNDLSDLRKVSGASRESVVREAFKGLLTGWGKSRHLKFVAEYRPETLTKDRRYVDGALLHELRVPFGYWEAKDLGDDLDKEIDLKFRRGYPQTNILFENSHEAVLIQDKEQVMRCGVEDIAALEKLLRLFFDYEPKQIADFRKAVAQFKTDLPAVLAALRAMIEAAYRDKPEFKAAAAKFLAHAQETINPSVTDADVREMLIQHILTEEIFSQVFDNSDFHSANNVAKELYALEGTFFTGGLKRKTLEGLKPYYAAIRSAAALVGSHHEKQAFLKVIYENFYKVYNPKAADRLGVVYTPNEIVRFMIESADWLCQQHFGKALIDKNVEILDPAAGTGTFIAELLEHFRGQPKKLKDKYRDELHANEVAILPYYVANLNIEATYAAITGDYEEFPNLCFVDTLDNVAALKGAGQGHYGDLLGAVSEENVKRIKRQNKKKISVVIGNPPYNANQLNENENNKNREYPEIDKRIKETYIAASTAQKTKLYDMYARFFRWASDRVDENGIVAFVSNSSFVDARTYDGFRKLVAKEFNEIWIVDLKGNARTSGERRQREGGNVFGDQIRVGVAVYFCVKRKGLKGCRIRYEAIRDYAKADEKCEFLQAKPIAERPFQDIKPDKSGTWIDQTVNDFEDLLPLADNETKALTVEQKEKERAIFKLYSLGISTNRDEWLYDFDQDNLGKKVHALLSGYAKAPLSAKNFHDIIKWSETLKRRKLAAHEEPYAEKRIRQAAYRPFVKTKLYQSGLFIDRPGQADQLFPPGQPNQAICFSDVGARASFCALGVDGLADLHFGASVDAYQQVSRHRYVDGQRIDNITDWALEQFRKHYEGKRHGPLSPRGEGQGEGASGATGEEKKPPHPAASLRSASGLSPRGEAISASGAVVEHSLGKGVAARPITKDAIFHYVYAVLHDPIYREKYALNLKREFPRIPFYPDFWRWANWGEKLMALHIGYEAVEPWPLRRIEEPDAKAKRAGLAPKALLKADPDAGLIYIDSETQLTGIPAAAWSYKLGNRSALGWILDQYKEKTPKDPTIREKFNTYRFADHKEKVIDLLARVTRVSVETTQMVEAMRAARR